MLVIRFFIVPDFADRKLHSILSKSFEVVRFKKKSFVE